MERNYVSPHSWASETFLNEVDSYEISEISNSAFNLEMLMAVVRSKAPVGVGKCPN
jgi:hypothetical protein